MFQLKVQINHRVLFTCLILALGLAACQPVSAATHTPTLAPTIQIQATAAPTQPAPAATQTMPAVQLSATRAPTAAVDATATNQPQALWLPETLPQQLREAVKLPAGWISAKSAQEASLKLDLLTGSPSGAKAITWVYALVAPFPTVPDDLTLTALQFAWKNGADKSLPFSALLVDPSTAAVFTSLWGQPSAMVEQMPAGQIVDAAWAVKTAWAIVPFEQVEDRWKVIAVDGQSPVRKDFDPAKYGLKASFALQGEPSMISSFTGQATLPETNRRADHLTTVMLTGVTALVRGTASLMEGRGLDYPAQDIGDWLREADILHISNEVPFAKTCPEPFNWKGLVFCSRTKYIKLLEDVGTDVVELSGDHFQDWGDDSVYYTLDLYKKEGWKTYGGGANIEEARKPALFEHNGNKIAFIGCNAKPKGYAQASETRPGAIHCDMDEMAAEVKQLRADGYLPIVTFQHLEYYSYTANPILQKDFRQMADAGAIIVSGSQAHQPHAIEFKDDAFLHYGLGNLFFDQTNQGYPPRTAFIDRHVFYEGRHISTELLTIYFVDYARSRPMTLEERQKLLTTVFKASGW